MGLSRKRPPANAARELQDLYRIINDLIDAVNQSQTVNTRIPDSEGKAGDIRVGKHPDENGDMKRYFEIRSDEGWHSIELP